MKIPILLSSGSAKDIGAAIFAGDLTSLEATEWYLSRIDLHNQGGAEINAVRSVSLTAREEAMRADLELAQGRSRGPLHGVPYLIKDNAFTTDGCFASAGASALSEFLPPYEATVVTRLREAGAVLLGKTNLTEFADFVSDIMPSEYSGAGGRVRNPLGTLYGRGQGSSIGSAAAVSAGFCAFAIGSETQNSLQTPAVHSSVVGFKPSVGRVSRYGFIPLVPSQDSPGPLTRTVRDAQLVYEAMAGTDVKDTATLKEFAAERHADTLLNGLRIGVPRRAIADNMISESSQHAFNRLLKSLSQAGATIVDPCDLPSAEQLQEVRSCVFRVEFRESLNILLKALSPCGMTSLKDIIAWNKKHPESIPYGQSLLEVADSAPEIHSREYIRDRRHDLVLSLDAGISAALKSGQADVLLSPMSAAAKCTGKAGAPVVAVPAGEDAEGLAFGITVYAEPGQDNKVLRVAGLIEGVVGARIIPELNRS